MCRAEAPHLTEIQKKYGDKVVVLGVNADNDPKEGIEGFVKRNNLTHRILMRGNGLAMTTYSVRGFPTTYWVDRRGRLVSREYGYISLENLEKQLEDLLK